MSVKLNEILIDLVKFYKEDPIVIITSGAGIGLSNVLRIPGSSNVIHECTNLYSVTSLSRTSLIYKFVSVEQVKELHYLIFKQGIYNDPNDRCLSIVGALTTNRWRKGPNHAYIMYGTINDYRIYHVELPKLSEEEYNKLSPDDIIQLRQKEDDQVCYAALWILMNPKLFNYSQEIEGIKITDVNTITIPKDCN